MRHLLILTIAIVLLSCNSKKESEGDKKGTDTTSASKVVLPQKLEYDGTTAVGKKENIVVVMNFNTDFIAGKMDNMASYFADSVSLTFADGSTMNGPRDSVLAAIKAYRDMLSSAQQTYIGAVALDNTDKGDEWVFQWIDETHNYKDGKVEHVVYHEDYRLVNGKIRAAYQYAQGVPKKK